MSVSENGGKKRPSESVQSIIEQLHESLSKSEVVLSDAEAAKRFKKTEGEEESCEGPTERVNPVLPSIPRPQTPEDEYVNLSAQEGQAQEPRDVYCVEVDNFSTSDTLDLSANELAAFPSSPEQSYEQMTR